jgi:hypothetical protein
LVGSFDELAFLEDGAGADEGDQVRCVTGNPSWSKAVRDGSGGWLVRRSWTRPPVLRGRGGARCIRTTDTVLKGDYLRTSVQYERQLAPDVAYRLACTGVLAARQR